MRRGAAWNSLAQTLKNPPAHSTAHPLVYGRGMTESTASTSPSSPATASAPKSLPKPSASCTRACRHSRKHHRQPHHYKLGAEHWLETGETARVHHGRPQAALTRSSSVPSVADPAAVRSPPASSNAKYTQHNALGHINLPPPVPRRSLPLANPRRHVSGVEAQAPYIGNGGVIRGGTPHEIATEVLPQHRTAWSA